jgi:hypothetical protein
MDIIFSLLLITKLLLKVPVPFYVSFTSYTFVYHLVLCIAPEVGM